MNDAKQIAVFRMGRLGDFISAIPALSIIKNKNPKSKIIYISAFNYSGGAALKARKYVSTKIPEWFELYRNTLIDDVVFIDNAKNINNILAVRKILKSKNITRTIMLPFVNESVFARIKKHAFLQLLGLNAAIMPASKIQNRNKPDYVSETTWAAVKAIVEELKIGVFEISYPEPCIPQSAFNRVKEISEIYNFDINKMVLIAVGATYAHKQLPEGNFTMAIKRLSQRGFTSVIIGSNNNQESGEKLFAIMKGTNVVNLVGQTSFMELAALMSKSKFVIGNDGGPMHLAAAMGVPTLTIMSAIYKENVWAPTNRLGKYIKLSPNCSGCKSELYCPNGTSKCVNDISEDMLVDCVDEVLNKNNL